LLDLPSPPPYTAEKDEDGEEDQSGGGVNQRLGVQTLPVSRTTPHASLDKIQQLLLKQNEIEKKLGKKYYKTVR
jgi:hypothetical protein